jgi:uroporphyrinogen-III synthase
MYVWLTRSEPGASRQAAVLEAAGHRCLVAPVLDIEPVAGDAPAGPYDVVIFLSEHAVRLGLPRLRPGTARIFAVGARTAEVLEAAGHRALQPERPDSEGLLALPQLAAVRGQRILLVCGAAGRTLLAAELGARGAAVDRFVCYRRRAVEVLDAGLDGVEAIVAGSADGLTQIARLWVAAGGTPDVPLLVPSGRVRAHGVALGFRNVHDCEGADAAAVLRGLERLARAGAG